MFFFCVSLMFRVFFLLLVLFRSFPIDSNFVFYLYIKIIILTIKRYNVDNVKYENTVNMSNEIQKEQNTSRDINLH